MSNKQFARAVRDTALRHGRDAKCTHTSVQRWRDGRMSRAVPPELIAETLSLALGRMVSTADIGMAAARQNARQPLVLEFLDDPAEIVTAARALWVGDLDHHDSTRTAIPAGALSGPALHWLVATASAAPVGHGPGQEVTRADIGRVHATACTFETIGRRHGGATARLPAVQSLHTGLTPLVTGRFSGAVGRSLFGTAAQANLGIGRYTHDAGLHGLARRYLLLALCMAHQADDWLLGAHVLVTLANQSFVVGDHRPTFDLVRAAIAGTLSCGPRARAALYAAEARAHAARGSASAARASLAKAERGLARPSPEDADWLGYFGPAELADTAAQCHLDLGGYDEARRHATAANTARSRDRVIDQVVSHCVLAGAYAGLGEVDEACLAAEAALAASEGMHSTVVGHHMDRLASRLDLHADRPRVAGLVGHLRGSQNG